MKKVVTFEQFAAQKAKETQIQLEEELNSKREASANSFKDLLAEFGVSSAAELSEKDRPKFNERLGTLTESALLLEGTNSQVGKIDKNGKITSVYVHYDGYPEHMVPMIKNYDKKGVDRLVKLGKSGISYLDKKIGKKQDFNNPTRGTTLFYGRDRGQNNDMTTTWSNAADVKGYFKEVVNDGGAEYVYLYDERDGKWYMGNTYDGSHTLQVVESVNEAARLRGPRDWKRNIADELNFDGDTYMDDLDNGYAYYEVKYDGDTGFDVTVFDDDGEEIDFDSFDATGMGSSEIEDKMYSMVRDLNESIVTEAKGFKNTEDFESFLKEIDSMPEFQIKKIMGKDYIDTPGFYEDEKDDYEDVIDFMMSNMGREDFNELKDWWENNVAESVVTEAKGPSKDFGLSAKSLKNLKVGDLVWKQKERHNPQLGVYYTLNKKEVAKVKGRKIWVVDKFASPNQNYDPDDYYDRNTGDKGSNSGISYGSAYYSLLTHQQVLDIIKQDPDRYNDNTVKDVKSLNVNKAQEFLNEGVKAQNEAEIKSDDEFK
jgi:hypothetical protein